MTGFTRTEALEAAALTIGGAALGGIVLGGRAEPADSRGSPAQDAQILNLVLLLEHVQVGFYAEAISRAGLSGELLTFASTAGRHERAHRDFLAKALGSDASKPPALDFGAATADPDSFGKAAIELEDLAVRAYNAGAPSLTRPTLAAAARIVSVEARHAAWILDLRDEIPAPEAAEPTMTVAAVQTALDRYVR